jgi:hypothetical protein
MRKVIIFFVFIFGGLCCKAQIKLINKDAGISVILPDSAKEIDAINLKGKYSGGFYSKINNRSRMIKWDRIYLLDDSVLISVRFFNKSPFFEKERTIHEYSYAIYHESNGAFTKKETEINGRSYLLYYYKHKDNNNDYFVRFFSDITKNDRVLGLIRYPSGYSIDQIEKKTVEILSGIQFEK